MNFLIDIEHFSFQLLDSNWSQYSHVNMVPFHYNYGDDGEPTRKIENCCGKYKNGFE